MAEQTAKLVRKKTSFSRDVLKLVSGTTLAQLLTIGAAPIFTRMFSPEAYGIVALFGSVTGIIGVIVCLRYELTIVLPKNDEEAVNLLRVSLGFVVLISAFIVPVVWWGREPLLLLLNAPGLEPYLWLIPVSIFLGGISLALNYWATRTKNFGNLSLSKIGNSIVSVSTQLIAGFAGYTTAGVIIGTNIAGLFTSALILIKKTWGENAEVFEGNIQWKPMLDGMRRYKKFPLYGTWSALLNTVSWQLPAIMLSVFFSPTVVGYYALSDRLLKVPMSIIGSAVGQVFFQHAAEAKINNNLANIVENSFKWLVLIGLLPSLLLAFIGHDLFTVIFGEKWAEAGVYTQILSIWFFFWFVSSPLSTLVSIFEKQRFEFLFQTLLFISRLASFAIGGWLKNIHLALMLFSVTGILLYGFLIIWMISASGIALIRAFKIVAENMMILSPALILLILLRFLQVDKWSMILAAFIISACYLLYLLLNPFTRNAMKSM